MVSFMLCVFWHNKNGEKMLFYITLHITALFQTLELMQHLSHVHRVTWLTKPRYQTDQARFLSGKSLDSFSFQITVLYIWN